MERSELIYDWNWVDRDFDPTSVHVELDDETLRDGLQNPSVKDPPIERKLEMLHLMVDLGIQAVDIGLPGAGPPGETRRAGVGHRDRRPGSAHLAELCRADRAG